MGEEAADSPVPIIELDDSHVDAVVALWERVGLTRPWNPADQDFLRAYRRPSSTVLGLLEGSLLLGTVMVGHDGHRGWAYYLAVHPAQQGRGIGRRLMSAAEGWVRAAGVPKIQLMVRRDNQGAVNFYRQLGYEEADVFVLAHWLHGR